MEKTLICIECPIGCEITVNLEKDNVVSVVGNTCPRGKAYAINEVVCPKRVITSTIKTKNGKIVAVKTDKPVRKDLIFDIMKIINQTICNDNVNLGDVVVKNICDDASLIVTGI